MVHSRLGEHRRSGQSDPKVREADHELGVADKQALAVHEPARCPREQSNPDVCVVWSDWQMWLEGSSIV